MRALILLLSVITVSACSTQQRKRELFTGTWVGNEAESVMLPGQHVPKNMIGIMEDSGHFLRTAQVFFDEEGKEIRRYVWDSECDGKASPVIGINPPGSATLSCRRIDADAFQMELRASGGYSHTETCRLSPNGRKHTCTGTATLPDGSKHDFVYVFDRK